MKRTYLFLMIMMAVVTRLNAQQFINKATIEYEVKANIQKTMGNNMWDEMLKENLPQFKTGYYSFTFSGDKSVYKFERWDEKAKLPEFLRKSDEENVWYFDHAAGKMNMQKNVFGSNFNVEDSIPRLEWKILNENRMIAGFNCRKAVARIFDSVYIFAFYTDEILIPGGPCSISGLPGMIMGLTIPRLYTSWIATKVMINGVQESTIRPVTVKKYYSSKTLKSTVYERIKDWTSEDDSPEEKQQKDRFVWNILL